MRSSGLPGKTIENFWKFPSGDIGNGQFELDSSVVSSQSQSQQQWISTTSSVPTLSFIAVARVGVSLGHDKVFFDGCYVCVFPRGPVKLIGELTG